MFLTYATCTGHAFLDRALYLPQSWAGDPDRRDEAGVPEDVHFRTKPVLAQRLITDALDAGNPARWVAGDEVYGNDPKLRKAIETRSVGYVLAISCSHRVTTATGKIRADILTAGLPKRAWQPRSAGDGAKGPRIYDWAWIEIAGDDDKHTTGCRWLLVRRNQHIGELAFYRCWAPGPVTLAQLVKVAGRRWSIEENFQTAKGLTGLDQHQVRHWRSWHRWTLLAMLAYAFLSILAAGQRELERPSDGLIAFTRNEIRHRSQLTP
ncbi:IS701 family transposase [Nocardia xishanensis]